MSWHPVVERVSAPPATRSSGPNAVSSSNRSSSPTIAACSGAASGTSTICSGLRPGAVEGCAAAVRVDVDEHAIRAGGVGHHRVRVRPAPRAHRRGVPRGSRVADVEDADALPVLIGLGHARRLARVVGHGLVDRHDDEVADRAHVALPARARDGAHELGCRRIGDVPDGEPRVVALHQVVAREREVGVDEVGVVALPERVVAVGDPLEPGTDRRLALGGRGGGGRSEQQRPRRRGR